MKGFKVETKLKQVIQKYEYKRNAEELDRMAFLARIEGHEDIAKAYIAAAYSLRR